MDIKDFLKARRKELGLSQLEVAQKVGVSEGTISRWESGNIANMKRDRIYKLAKVLDVDPSTIIFWDEETPPAPAEAVSDPTEQEVLEAFRQLSPEQQQLVLSLLETMK